MYEEYDYEYDGFGLEITTPHGSCYLQGEEAEEAYDELEELETDEQIVQYLLQYEHVCE